MRALIMRNALFAFGLTAISLSPAQANYIGPSSIKTIGTVAEILKDPVDDQRVLLRGYLIKQVGKEKYIFSDGSNEIRVEIDYEVFRGQTVDEKTRVELVGEVEKDFLESPEVDVEVLTLLPQ